MLIDWKSIPVASGMRPGSARQAIAARNISAVRVVTAPDAAFDGTLHRHENEQILIMITGVVTLQIDDEVFDAVPGDLVFFPPGSLHGALAVGSGGAVYYELFAPSRLDQLPGWVGPGVLEFV
ncbi:cupin domain-containing protein [Rathayibacter soli]|uniref:cupin domain-containing protein n=1 Tax=Rathayibacter soli TaxID=3144168 RepID=UPI0027E3F9D8|nr:cupin domain-containing protein [Glaciibacter superstes]